MLDQMANYKLCSAMRASLFLPLELSQDIARFNLKQGNTAAKALGTQIDIL